jgi:hypothetical protein
MSETKTFTSLLETILQIQASAATARGNASRTVEVTDEDETVFVSFVPVPTQTRKSVP